MAKTLVIALGGNAITRPNEPGVIPAQFAHTAETLRHLSPLFRSDHRIVITHGNGPQIGNILLRVEAGETAPNPVPHLPLDTCAADCQGGMGYMIQRLAGEMLRRETSGAYRPRNVVTVITQVVVDKNHPEFQHPSKPIGPFFSAGQMERIRREKPHWITHEIEPGRFRRVVPSPRPLDVMEKDIIAKLSEAGVIVIACGGGGIPVAWENNHLIGVEAVIDKDLASSLLATQIRAHKLIIVTSVPQAAIRYHKPDQQWLGTLTLAEARRYLDAGEFPPGTMGPKIEAAIDFIEQGGEECIITSTEQVARAVEGEGGTRIAGSWVGRRLVFPSAQALRQP
ncbi:MAG: carbamate kinase [Candidatus Acidiferrales bacterium]